MGQFTSLKEPLGNLLRRAIRRANPDLARPRWPHKMPVLVSTAAKPRAAAFP
jgi:hypothetical protein